MTIGSAVFSSFLRARMAGTVIRFPGTGVGVARLVALSIVKVDIGFLIAAGSPCSQSCSTVVSSLPAVLKRHPCVLRACQSVSIRNQFADNGAH